MLCDIIWMDALRQTARLISELHVDCVGGFASLSLSSRASELITIPVIFWHFVLPLFRIRRAT